MAKRLSLLIDRKPETAYISSMSSFLSYIGSKLLKFQFCKEIWFLVLHFAWRLVPRLIMGTHHLIRWVADLYGNVDVTAPTLAQERNDILKSLARLIVFLQECEQVLPEKLAKIHCEVRRGLQLRGAT